LLGRRFVLLERILGFLGKRFVWLDITFVFLERVFVFLWRKFVLLDMRFVLLVGGVAFCLGRSFAGTAGSLCRRFCWGLFLLGRRFVFNAMHFPGNYCCKNVQKQPEQKKGKKGEGV